MKPEHLIVALIVIVVLALIVRSARAGGKDIHVPAPERLRTDLKFGYYLTGPRQIAETRGAVNLLWTSLAFEGLQGVIAQLREAAIDAVLDVDDCLFSRADGGRLQLRPDAAHKLRETLAALADAGVLHHVRSIVPIDEPNLPATNVGHHMREAAHMIRAVAAEFPALAGVRVGLVLFNRPSMHDCALDAFDWIAVDDYPAKSEVLRLYDGLRVRYPGVQFALFPGAYSENGKTHQQDLTPFINYAHAHADVWAIVVFLWEARHNVTQGARDLPVRDAYLAAGRAIVEAKG